MCSKMHYSKQITTVYSASFSFSCILVFHFSSTLKLSHQRLGEVGTANIFLKAYGCHHNFKCRYSTRHLWLYHRNYCWVFSPQQHILTHHITYSPSLSCLLTQTLFPTALFLTCQHTDQMCKCFSMFLFKPCSKRKAEWGERNIWLHSTGDQFHKFWRLHNGEKGSLAGLAEGECWRHTKQHDPNELENPWPSRGLSRCYRHEKSYCFIEFRFPSLSLTRGKIYYLSIKAS